MLQSQVTTLQWQLRQVEASRQMYRAVMEQVVSFLQKTHKNLDLLQNRLDDSVTRYLNAYNYFKEKKDDVRIFHSIETW